ncbi:MAG: 50S ribosomal protein L29 [bacterium]|nr:50S ribosomal protein L29 [bacterium]
MSKDEINELELEVKKKEELLRNYYFKLVSNELKDNSQIRKTKKEIAGLKTRINAKGEDG